MKGSLIAVVALSIILAKPAVSQCALSYSSNSCGTATCSSSTHINKPINGDTGYFPAYTTVNCCNVQMMNLAGFVPNCQSASLKTKESQKILARMNAKSPIYVANCDGWFRPFIPVGNTQTGTTNPRVIQMTNATGPTLTPNDHNFAQQ